MPFRATSKVAHWLNLLSVMLFNVYRGHMRLISDGGRRRGSAGRVESGVGVGWGGMGLSLIHI